MATVSAVADHSKEAILPWVVTVVAVATVVAAVKAFGAACSVTCDLIGIGQF